MWKNKHIGKIEMKLFVLCLSLSFLTAVNTAVLHTHTHTHTHTPHTHPQLTTHTLTSLSLSHTPQTQTHLTRTHHNHTQSSNSLHLTHTLTHKHPLTHTHTSNPPPYLSHTLSLTPTHTHTTLTLTFICSEHWSSPRSGTIYTCVVILTTYLIPLIILTFTYFKIGRTLWRRQTPGNADSTRDQVRSNSKKRVRLTKAWPSPVGALTTHTHSQRHTTHTLSTPTPY